MTGAETRRRTLRGKAGRARTPMRRNALPPQSRELAEDDVDPVVGRAVAVRRKAAGDSVGENAVAAAR